MGKTAFERDIQDLINRHSKEDGSNTPDFILAEFLNGCLESFNLAVRLREGWYGRPHRFGEIPEQAIKLAPPLDATSGLHDTLER